MFLEMQVRERVVTLGPEWGVTDSGVYHAFAHVQMG